MSPSFNSKIVGQTENSPAMAKSSEMIPGKKICTTWLELNPGPESFFSSGMKSTRYRIGVVRFTMMNIGLRRY